MNISIIIPSRNSSRVLLRTLESVAEVVSGGGAEIIIVDNGSMDETPSVCAAFKERYPKHLWRYFRDSVPGLLTGRHRGAREALGDVLAYLDDDVLLGPTWWESLQEVFQDPTVVLAGGPSLPEFEETPPGWLDELWYEFDGGRHCVYLSLIDQGAAPKPCDPCLVWGLNYAIRKQALYECGGFHPDCIPKSLQRYQGDGETGLSVKIKEHGLGCMYHPGLALRHIIPASRMTPAALERRGFYQGVCDSYTQVRVREAAGGPESWSWKDLLRPAKHKFERHKLLGQGTAVAVGLLHARAHSQGFRWHQNQVRNDPQLLEWILKRDYFDYALPERAGDYIKGQNSKSGKVAGRDWY